MFEVGDQIARVFEAQGEAHEVVHDADAFALNLKSGLYVFLAMMIMAGTVWVAGRQVMRSKTT